MGFGVEVRRLHGMRALISALVLLTLLATGARAERVSADEGSQSLMIPLICARPLASQALGNPACSSPRPAAAIYGTVYVDTNVDGRYDPELALGGWDAPVENAEVRLQRADWAEPLIAPLYNGYYCFEALDAGDYVVTIALSPEDEIVLEPLDPEPGVQLLDDEAVNRDFRYARWFTPPQPPMPGPTYSLHLPTVMVR